MSDEQDPNRLARETSPYLLQHAGNPVDWYPWGEEAMAKAREVQKPIFLSIGYSTCHWCHVMAHESFENPDIATLLNRHFVCVKVDREERPDIDRIYMTYVQATTGHGGWPMSVWMTPDLKPFYGGTYFPPHDHHNRPGFATLLHALANAWANEREKVINEGENAMKALSEYVASKADSSVAVTVDVLIKGLEYYAQAFDEQKGGFGGPPKFPRPVIFNFLFSVGNRPDINGEARMFAKECAMFTLQKMAQGGMRDHVGGGFHRYSVDEDWQVPHFEKMLYDQAQIVVSYLDAYQTSGSTAFAWVARDILRYVERDLTHSHGGFYSAEDADSEVPAGRGGVDKHKAEGAFYLWTEDELRVLLGEKVKLIQTHFRTGPDGNVSSQRDPHREFGTGNVLAQAQSLSATAAILGRELNSVEVELIDTLETLRIAREKRIRPHLDDKIITAWNGLMISACAKASQILTDDGEKDHFLKLGSRAARFVRDNLYEAGVLFRSWRNGQRGNVEGFADDYAFLIQGLLDLYESSFEISWLQWALELQQKMDALFWDETDGGYFNNVRSAAVPLRVKEDYDGAEPSPNSIAAKTLFRLGRMIHRNDLVRRADKIVQSFSGRLGSLPQGLPQLLVAVDMMNSPPMQLVLAGDPASTTFRSLRDVAYAVPARRFVVVAADGGPGHAWLATESDALRSMRADGSAVAFFCADYVCQLPVSSPDELRKLLAQYS